MAVLRDATELTVTEAAQRGVARLVADAEQGADLVVTRRHRPVAAVVSMRRLNELEEAAADLRDLALVLVRASTDSGRRTADAGRRCPFRFRAHPRVAGRDPG